MDGGSRTVFSSTEMLAVAGETLNPGDWVANDPGHYGCIRRVSTANGAVGVALTAAQRDDYVRVRVLCPPQSLLGKQSL
jgi:hypothetical protein